MIYFKCDQCGFRDTVEDTARAYQWPGIESSEELLFVITRTCWCRTCSKVVQAEYVPSLEALERELVLIRSNAPDEERFFTVSGFDDEQTLEITDYIQWRKGRIAPSKCFECGEEALLVPERRWSDLPCPHCSGILRCSFDIIGATGYNFTLYIYSTEGVLLEKAIGRA